MELKVETKTEVTLKMTSDDFKKMMNGLQIFAYDYESTSKHKEDAGDVFTMIQSIVKREGFQW